MALEIPTKALRKSVQKIVRNGDLSTLTNKTVRAQLESYFEMPLKERKQEINDMVLAALSALEEAEHGEERPHKKMKKAALEEADHTEDRPQKKMKKATLEEVEEEERPKQKSKKEEKRPASIKENSGQPKPPACEEEAEEAQLRDVIRLLKLTAKTRFKGVGALSTAARLERLRGILVDAVKTTRPSKKQIAKFIAARERELELDGIDATNIIVASGRPRRAAAEEHSLLAPPAASAALASTAAVSAASAAFGETKRRRVVEDDEDEEDEDEEDEDEESGSEESSSAPPDDSDDDDE